MFNLKEAVGKATHFATKSLANHHVVIVGQNEVSGSSGYAGCSIKVAGLDHWKPKTVVGVSAADLKKVLTAVSPETIDCRRNGLILTDSDGSVKIPGIIRTSLPDHPQKPDDSEDWKDLSEAQVSVLSVLGDVASTLNVQENLRGVHIGPNWVAALSSSFVAVGWLGLVTTENLVSTPAEVWGKLASKPTRMLLHNGKVWLDQGDAVYWTQTLVSSMTASGIDALLGKCRDQPRTSGVLDSTALRALARRTVACSKSPTDIYEWEVVDHEGDKLLKVSGESNARIDGHVAWAGDLPETKTPICMAADHMLLATTTLNGIVAQPLVSLSFSGSTDPVLLHGVTDDNTTLELLINPSYSSR